jgi:hypothetical protein
MCFLPIIVSVSIVNFDDIKHPYFQVAFTDVEPRWQLPWLWFDEYFQVEEDVMLHLVIMDTESMWTRFVAQTQYTL